MTTLVTGATGTIGKRLVPSLLRLGPVRVLTRAPERVPPALETTDVVAWDGSSPLPRSVFQGVEAVIHLAGEPVGEGRWTQRKKDAIRGSRVTGTRALVASMQSLEVRPKTLVCASAMGLYGDRGDEALDESSAPGTGFLSDVCVAWEREARTAETAGVRVVRLRLGIVLDREGGALARMLTPFRLGLGGPLGDGSQWMPWVHVDDAVGIAMHALGNEVAGALNAVSPEPSRQVDFARALAEAVHRPSIVRMPKVSLRLAFGEMADVLLASQRVRPARTLASGYAFMHPDLRGALHDLLSPHDPRARDRSS